MEIFVLTRNYVWDNTGDLLFTHVFRTLDEALLLQEKQLQCEVDYRKRLCDNIVIEEKDFSEEKLKKFYRESDKDVCVIKRYDKKECGFERMVVLEKYKNGDYHEWRIQKFVV